MVFAHETDTLLFVAQSSRRDHGLIWITGLSGAGKSTVSLILRDKFLSEGVRPIVLDGDALRECLNAKGMYSFQQRLDLAKTYSRIATLLVQQKHLVIVATMSLFREVHRMNRQSKHPYLEVFLDLPITTLRQRDTKGLYGSDDAGAVANVGGLNLDLETPLNPDMHITDPTSDPYSLADVILQAFTNLP